MKDPNENDQDSIQKTTSSPSEDSLSVMFDDCVVKFSSKKTVITDNSGETVMEMTRDESIKFCAYVNHFTS